jgi:uncharacterized protein
MSLYFDASVLVALFVIDPSSAKAEAFLIASQDVFAVSDFAAAEFSSAMARRVRMRLLTLDEATRAFANFDSWITGTADWRETIPADIATANRILRRLTVNLRTPDALHIAIAGRLNATLVTFDNSMATAGRALGLAVSTP